MTAPIFSVGDRVRVVDPSGHRRAVKGDVGTVTRLDGGLLYIQTDRGPAIALFDFRVEPATPLFAVGDPVKIVANPSDYVSPGAQVGKVGEVVRLQPDRADGRTVYVNVESSSGGFFSLSFAPASLEKVEPEPEQTFAVGDRVRLLPGATSSDPADWRSLPAGTIAVVAEAGPDRDGDVHVEALDGGVGWTLARYLEKVAPEPAPKPPLPAIGDRFVVTRTGSHGFAVGDVVTVCDTDGTYVPLVTKGPFSPGGRRPNWRYGSTAFVAVPGSREEPSARPIAPASFEETESAAFEAALVAFREAWHRADLAGRKGTRSREGLVAALAAREAVLSTEAAS